MIMTELDDIELQQLRIDLEQWAEAACYSDRFRRKCARTAIQIAAHLEGQGDDALLVCGIESIFNVMAQREAARLERVGDLEDELIDAAQAGDVKAWAGSFSKMVRLLSEEHIRAMMQLVSDLSDTGALEYPIEPRQQLLVHVMPEAVQ